MRITGVDYMVDFLQIQPQMKEKNVPQEMVLYQRKSEPHEMLSFAKYFTD